MPWEVVAPSLVAIAALAKAFWSTRVETREEKVDSGVLEQFLHLATKVAELEGSVASLRAEIADLQKVEEYLRGVIHEKDKQIEALRLRVTFLEESVRRVGADGGGC